MGDTEKYNMIQHSSSSSSSSSSTTNPNFNRRIGVPPTSPYSLNQIRPVSQNPNPVGSHSRSLSQPSSFFDSLPPLSPCPYKGVLDESSPLPPPPRKSHRRSNSDIITSGFTPLMMMMQIPLPHKPLERSEEAIGVKKETEVVVVEKEEAMDDLFSAYMNLDNIDDALNSSQQPHDDDHDHSKNMDDMESSKTNNNNNGGGSDTEGEETSSVNESSNSLKRRACGGDIAPTRHYRSVSVDSCFMDKFSFGDESPSSSLLKPPLSPGTISRKVSPTNSVDGNSGFSIEFKNGEFTAVEMKKIMANDKLAEMAMSDPKRVKRILANRQSAARSKERKMRYIVELEHKVQTLQTEATTLSAQLTLLQRDMMGLTNQNNELKFCLQAMEHQAQLRDALNESLNGELQRLKLAIGETSHDDSDRSKMQSLNAEMFQQLNISQSLRQQPKSLCQTQQNRNVSMETKPESK
ncbi:unnamed protein product [Cochlearia groenlandica]